MLMPPAGNASLHQLCPHPGVAGEHVLSAAWQGGWMQQSAVPAAHWTCGGLDRQAMLQRHDMLEFVPSAAAAAAALHAAHTCRVAPLSEGTPPAWQLSCGSLLLCRCCLPLHVACWLFL